MRTRVSDPFGAVGRCDGTECDSATCRAGLSIDGSLGVLDRSETGLSRGVDGGCLGLRGQEFSNPVRQLGERKRLVPAGPVLAKW